MQVTITLPSLHDVACWFGVYLYVGVIPWFVHCVSFVWCDYGRLSSNVKFRFLVVMSLIDLIMWPLNIHNTRQNLGGFNREYKYYR